MCLGARRRWLREVNSKFSCEPIGGNLQFVFVQVFCFVCFVYCVSSSTFQMFSNPLFITKAVAVFSRPLFGASVDSIATMVTCELECLQIALLRIDCARCKTRTRQSKCASRLWRFAHRIDDLPMQLTVLQVCYTLLSVVDVGWMMITMLLSLFSSRLRLLLFALLRSMAFVTPRQQAMSSKIDRINACRIRIFSLISGL